MEIKKNTYYKLTEDIKAGNQSCELLAIEGEDVFVVRVKNDPPYGNQIVVRTGGQYPRKFIVSESELKESRLR